jgi:phosphoribosyl-ATP pyrophosphohydrolase
MRKNRRDKIARLETFAGSNPTFGSNGKSVIRNCIAVAPSHAHKSLSPDLPERSVVATSAVLEQLFSALDQITLAEHPRTFKLLQSGRKKLARKVIEEACEVTVEAVKRSADGMVRESADLLYHLIVLWFSTGIEPMEVWQEMQSRASALGIAEKLPKTLGAKNTSATEC